MYKQHFGLTHIPFGKDTKTLWESPGLLDFKTQFTNLLHSPGIGVLIGEPGVGKTAAIRHVVFLRNFPAFLNFEFDAHDMLTFWVIGHPDFANNLNRNTLIALSSRIRVRCSFKPVTEREQFTQLIEHAFKTAGCQTKLLSDSGIEMLRSSSQGKLRIIHNILATSMQLAQQQNLNHLPEDVLKEAIARLKG